MPPSRATRELRVSNRRADLAEPHDRSRRDRGGASAARGGGRGIDARGGRLVRGAVHYRRSMTRWRRARCSRRSRCQRPSPSSPPPPERLPGPSTFAGRPTSSTTPTSCSMAPRSAWRSIRGCARPSGETGVRARRSRPRDCHAVHHRARLPHDLPPDLSHRRRGPRPRQLSDADRGRLPRARGAAQRAPRSRRRAARVRDRVDVQHLERPRPALPQLHRYGAHGVAGATAFATPALPAPIYFNESVLPDPAQQRSSSDGGVLWTGVPAGIYTVRARHPSTRFASFVATCRPGRVVNANPPWGLHELGKAMRAVVSARWSVTGAALRLRRLRVARLPAGATVRIECGSAVPVQAANRRKAGKDEDRPAWSARRGRARAPFRSDARRPRDRARVRRQAGPLAAGRGTGAEAVTRCVPLGNTRPRLRC